MHSPIRFFHLLHCVLKYYMFITALLIRGNEHEQRMQKSPGRYDRGEKYDG